MNWYFIFYLFSIANAANKLFIGLAIFFSVVLVITTILNFPAGTFDNPKMSDINIKTNKFIMKWTYVIVPILFLLWIVVPDRKDMLVIISGGAVGQFLTNDENAKEIPADVSRFLRTKIIQATVEEGDKAVKQILEIDEAEETKDRLMEKSKEEIIEMFKDNPEVQKMLEEKK